MFVGQFMSYAQLLLFGASAPVALGATHYVCPWQTAEEQSAAFALISELLDANCLDYGASPTGVWLIKDYNFISKNLIKN
mgnify:CR=1 FL=1